MMVTSSWNSSFSSVTYTTCNPETPDRTSRGAAPRGPADGMMISVWLNWSYTEQEKKVFAFITKTSVHLDRDSGVLCWPQWCLSIGCYLCLSLTCRSWCSRIRHIWDQTLGLVQGCAVSWHEAPCPSVLSAGPAKDTWLHIYVQKSTYRWLNMDFVFSNLYWLG